MASNWLSQSIVTFFLLSIWGFHHVHCQDNIFTVSQFGAIPDAQTDNKQAFLNAWKNACATDGGTISIPTGNYLLSDAEFLGPCIGQTNFVLNGILNAPIVPTPKLDYWIMFRNVDSLSISGSGTGTLNGNGDSYWKSKQSTFITSLKLQRVNNVTVSDINSMDSKKFHFVVHNCNGVTITNIRATAHADSPNTDGVHLATSNDIRISDSNFTTGDDCISIGDGVTNMNVSGVNCGPGHGISIGSLGLYPGEKEVRSIRVTNCNLTSTDNGLRIKTFGPSPPGLVSDVHFEDIRVNNVLNPIIIDQHYCPGGKCNGGESRVSIKDVSFINVRGTSGTPVGVKFDCSKSQPCKGIELTGVSLTFKGNSTTAFCSSADVKFLGSANQIPSSC